MQPAELCKPSCELKAESPCDVGLHTWPSSAEEASTVAPGRRNRYGRGQSWCPGGRVGCRRGDCVDAGGGCRRYGTGGVGVLECIIGGGLGGGIAAAVGTASAVVERGIIGAGRIGGFVVGFARRGVGAPPGGRHLGSSWCGEGFELAAGYCRDRFGSRRGNVGGLELPPRWSSRVGDCAEQQCGWAGGGRLRNVCSIGAGAEPGCRGGRDAEGGLADNGIVRVGVSLLVAVGMG